mgnify:CR=1 FL=1
MKIGQPKISLREGKTKPPARFTEGTLLSAMENPVRYMENRDSSLVKTIGEAGGLGTVATRADIIEKLFRSFLLEKKGNEIYLTSKARQLLKLVPADLKKPELTASWEKGLNYVAEGEITSDEYMTKLDHFIVSRTNGVLGLNNQYQLRSCYDRAAAFYKKETKGRASKGKKE